ncbi:hypothetical protein ACTID9_20750 [Brevibacillus fluminis]|uniref:hypothetical protein n=1 Tax=Brevibacillus fluminis TaxID=511487 RepID=UPI003F8C2ED0
MNDWLMYTDASGEQKNHVAWHEVLKEIAQLNGTTHTMVHAAYGDHVDLVVAGGNDGLVLVQWKENDPEPPQHFVLAMDQSADQVRMLTVEGQDAELPIGWCVPLQLVVPVCGDMLRTCEKANHEQLFWLNVSE